MSKTDQELLELAAKAAGIEGHIGDAESPYDYDRGNWWSPLDDDGQAMRLAVKLQMDLELGLGGCSIVAAHVGLFEELSTHDPYAATRRAIVRAAADISEREVSR